MRDRPVETSALAIVSLVFGILAWIALPLIGALIAIVTGHMARSQIRAAYGGLQGDGLAVAGLVLGYLQFLIGLFAITLIFFGFGLLAFLA
ncbi:MAG: DUF4190 domain-containing protein [Wenzhouxiangella sp.]|nr:MAG: DUF4190 domain-containing protein [Wenzhouxiangella sp.]